MSNALQKKLVLATNNLSITLITDFFDEAQRDAVGLECKIDSLKEATVMLMKTRGMQEEDAKNLANIQVEELDRHVARVWAECLVATVLHSLSA